MCGIAGFLSPRYNMEHLQCSTSAISYRGPDGEGFFFESAPKGFNIGLGHRRLSILDLSDAASQPMKSHNGRYIMIFNGEIYNYQEIKNSKFTGMHWRSTGDSEVILESFAQFGPDCFSWFNGMFTVAIWDSQDNKLTLARDHVGIKPLYYYYDGSEVIFASELKAITSIRKRLTYNYAVIPAFLHIGYIPHPDTIYNNIMKMGAGSYAEVSISSAGAVALQEHNFWNIQDKISADVIKDEAIALKKLDELLSDSVEKQLISDVPIGTFLSGGTDSSIVTAMAAKVSPGKINTYSIAVKDGKVNEAPYAAAVAAHLHTNHHELPITQQEIMEMVPGFINVYDEPFSDSSAFPTMLVSKLARKNVTVALSGDGGDELFWGYGSYLWAKRLKNPVVRLLSPAIYAASKKMNSRYKRIGMLFEKHDPDYFKSHLFSQDQYYFTEKELHKLLVNPQVDFSGINKSYSGRDLTIQEQMSFWDIENYLKDDLLVKVDRASMQYSLETRVPLLDYRIIEFALNLSHDLKIGPDGSMKYLLKQVLYQYVPKALLDRPKWGFSIPMVKWLKTDLKWMIDKYCSKEVIEQTGVVKYEVVKDIVSKYFSGSDYLYKRIWALIVLHWFFYEQR
jgi:asparagine synthase (glutamine-hydrolysing)